MKTYQLQVSRWSVPLKLPVGTRNFYPTVSTSTYLDNKNNLEFELTIFDFYRTVDDYKKGMEEENKVEIKTDNDVTEFEKVRDLTKTCIDNFVSHLSGIIRKGINFTCYRNCECGIFKVKIFIDSAYKGLKCFGLDEVEECEKED